MTDPMGGTRLRWDRGRWGIHFYVTDDPDKDHGRSGWDRSQYPVFAIASFVRNDTDGIGRTV